MISIEPLSSFETSHGNQPDILPFELELQQHTSEWTIIVCCFESHFEVQWMDWKESDGHIVCNSNMNLKEKWVHSVVMWVHLTWSQEFHLRYDNQQSPHLQIPILRLLNELWDKYSCRLSYIQWTDWTCWRSKKIDQLLYNWQYSSRTSEEEQLEWIHWIKSTIKMTFKHKSISKCIKDRQILVTQSSDISIM